jgi:hypothetical protein
MAEFATRLHATSNAELLDGIAMLKKVKNRRPVFGRLAGREVLLARQGKRVGKTAPLF